jgi:hypothetical protein
MRAESITLTIDRTLHSIAMSDSEGGDYTDDMYGAGDDMYGDGDVGNYDGDVEAVGEALSTSSSAAAASASASASSSSSSRLAVPKMYPPPFGDITAAPTGMGYLVLGRQVSVSASLRTAAPHRLGAGVVRRLFESRVVHPAIGGEQARL